MGREAHGAQDVRRLERSRRAGRPGRHRDSLEVERDQEALGFDAVEADVRRVGDARRSDTVDCRPADALQDAVFEAIAQPRQPIAFARQLVHSKAGRDAEPDNRRHVFGPGAPIALVLAARHRRHHSRAAFDPQRAGAFRPSDFVGGEGHAVTCAPKLRRKLAGERAAPARSDRRDELVDEGAADYRNLRFGLTLERIERERDAQL